MVARSCTHVTREAGTVFVREGQTSREFVLIDSGSVVVIRQGFPEVVLGAGEWFGDIELLSDGTSSATVTALTAVECTVMSRPEFACLFDAVPSFRKRLVRSVASIARLRSDGGGSQILPQDPSGDVVGLFQPASR
jgi:CRP-like cAMP-binding protein